MKKATTTNKAPKLPLMDKRIMQDPKVAKIVEEIWDKRLRQITKHGFTPDRDLAGYTDANGTSGDLAMVAAVFAAPQMIYIKEEDLNAVSFIDPYNWSIHWDQRKRQKGPSSRLIDNKYLSHRDRRRMLITAAALIAAEVQRLDAIEARNKLHGKK